MSLRSSSACTSFLQTFSLKDPQREVTLPVKEQAAKEG